MSDLSKSRLSRRQLLKLSFAAAGVAASTSLLAACQGAAPSPGATQPPAKSGEKLTLSCWNSPSFNEKADVAIGDVFREWGSKNNVEINYQVVPEAERRQRYTAAIEADQPPDLAYTFEAELQYYRTQDLLVDITSVINDANTKEGGIFESALQNTGYEGKYYGAPYVVNPWVMHVRLDLLKKANVDYPKTWEDVITISPKVSTPPQVYTYAMSLGDNNDTSNNFLAMVWAYGGQMQSDKGALMFKSDGTLEAIKVVKKMFDAKVIPPGSTTWDSAGNNKAYQSGQTVLIHNPNSTYAFLESEAAKADATQAAKDLFNNTGMYGMPAGPKGAFDMVDVRAFVAFKAGKDPAAAKDALKYFIDPTNYEKVIETGLNRWAPIYKNMMDRPLWDKPAYKNYKGIMANGRAMAYAGPPNAALDEVLNTWVISRMLQDVCTGGKDPAQAMDDTYKAMSDIYKKWKQPVA
ncbi:MAG: extracellular solute-binding protein [Dehalococcoidales bacterium]|nr:extracellular solute-binding protein [Dehalococcoidales bacterium]